MTDIKPPPVKAPITIDDLNRVDIRVGTIDRVEEMPKADKLVKLTVDFGDHKRTVLVGLAGERSNPQEIEGVQALFVINLKPREMMGEVSEAMLFDVGYADGIVPVLVTPQSLVPNGTRVG